MLRCIDIPERASDLLEGNLGPRAWLGVRLHLTICSMCRAHVDQLRKTRRLLGARPLAPADAAAEDAVIAALDEARRETRQ